MYKYLLISMLCSLRWASGQEEPPSVNISQGRVVGSRVFDGNFQYNQYLGIPYAGSTGGEHRFKAPTAPPLFEEEFVADRNNIKCIRPLTHGFEGTEDCLTVNIYAPNTGTENLPVMVWIHGSEFQNDGENALSFRNIVEQEIIVVALNYRESIFGFLCLGIEEAPGNAGLKDIVAGLRWIQNNIEAFGGDPNSVTLFGHGSGAAAVDLVTLSSSSQGLIHKAITQSGSSTAPWAIAYDPRANAISVAEKLGHLVTDGQSLVEIFKRTSVGILLAAIKELELTDNTLVFAPCIENGKLDNEEALFTESPLQILQNGNYNAIPYITGYVENEGTVRAQQALEADWLDKMDTSFPEFLQQDLTFETENDMVVIAEEIKAYYFQGRSVDMTSISDFIRYHGDTMFLIPSIRNARLRALTSVAPVYLYQFSYEGLLGEPLVGPLSVQGAAHGEELAYLFDIGVSTEPSALDTIVRNILVQRWTNFAKTGDPTNVYNSEVIWRPITATTINFLHIMNDESNTGTVEVALVSPHQERMAFWDLIYSQHYRQATAVWEEGEELIDGNQPETEIDVTIEDTEYVDGVDGTSTEEGNGAEEDTAGSDNSEEVDGRVDDDEEEIDEVQIVDGGDEDDTDDATIAGMSVTLLATSLFAVLII